MNHYAPCNIQVSIHPIDVKRLAAHLEQKTLVAKCILYALVTAQFIGYKEEFIRAVWNLMVLLAL